MEVFDERGDKIIFKELETERLLWKNISMEDTEFILSQFSDDDVNEYLYDEEPMTERKEAVDLIRFYTSPEPRKQHRWILVRKCDGEKIGTCGFHCWYQAMNKIDVGYDMKKAYWKNGYMQEAVKVILKFAQSDLQIHTIEAHIYPENKNSVSLVTKLGFRFNGKTIVYTFRGKDYVHNIYELEQ